MADYERRMLHTDAFSWYMESDPALRSTVVAVALLDRAPDWEHLKQRVERMTRLVPRFRQRVEQPPLRLGPPRWVLDPDFDLDWHMRRMRLPRGAGWPDALEVARVAAMDGFDRDRPLWEATVLEGLPDGRVALVTKMHHALSDGVGAIQLMAYFVDFGRDLPDLEELPPVPVEASMTSTALVTSSLRDDAAEVLQNVARTAGALRHLPELLRDPVGSATSVAGTAASVARLVRPVRHNASPVITHRSAVRRLATFDVPLAALKAAARPNGGHLNDAFLAGLTGGLRRYHEAHGADVSELRVTMPMSVRKPDDPLGGNRITLLRFAVPVGLADPAARITRTAEITRAWQCEPAIAHTQGIAFALNLVPRSYIQGILRRVEFVASDVPGLTQPVYVGGARVLAYYPFGPTIGTGMNATLMSYAGTCNIGLNIDTCAIPDPDELILHVRAGFDEVLALGPAADSAAAAG